MNLAEAAKLVAILKGVYLREQFTDASPQAFFWLLEDQSYELVLEAAKIHGRRSKWCPTPAELLAIIAEAAVPDIGHGEGWSEVQTQINRHGVRGYEKTEWAHPAVALAVQWVGWERLCMDELRFSQPAFYKALDAAQARLRREAQDGGASIPLGDRSEDLRGRVPVPAIAANGRADEWGDE